tara:strand:- start:7195 stop:7899 length:705 start_codon:yes stop_codon:yes gene_type:complete
MNNMEPKQRIICALDFENIDLALNLIKKIEAHIQWYKIGMELFTKEGPRAVEMVIKRGSSVFLDLKYHDIPATVEKAIFSAANLGVSLLTVHASGGEEMLEACARARDKIKNPPSILAVTVLTSLGKDSLKKIGIKSSPAEQVLKMGLLAKKCGLNGVVASPMEVSQLRGELGKDMLIVTPGVRLDSESQNDHARVHTPKNAIENGADYIVVGRPIRNAENPEEIAQKYISSIS